MFYYLKRILKQGQYYASNYFLTKALKFNPCTTFSTIIEVGEYTCLLLWHLHEEHCANALEEIQLS